MFTTGVQASSTQHTSMFDQLQNLLSQKKWSDASKLANAIDLKIKKGDSFKAYTTAVRHAGTGECQKAKPLAKLAIKSRPEFLPFYAPLARCLIKDGNASAAVNLYKKYAALVSDGPAKDKALIYVKKLTPSKKVKTSVNFDFTPSTNVIRQTNEDKIGSFVIDDASKAQAGFTLGLNANLDKPLFYSGRLSNLVRLKIGFNYNNISEKLYPLIGIESQFNFALNSQTKFSVTPFYDHMWVQGESYRHNVGTRSSVQYNLDKKNTFALSSQFGWHKYADTNRSGLQARINFQYINKFTPRDRFTFGLSAIYRGAKSEILNNREFNISAEWEHVFENGLVPSFGGDLKYRHYKGDAPLTSKNQYDFSAAARVGLSHRKIKFGNVHPEVTFTATRQWSNNVFYKFMAYDVGLRLKTTF